MNQRKTMQSAPDPDQNRKPDPAQIRKIAEAEAGIPAKIDANGANSAVVPSPGIPAPQQQTAPVQAQDGPEIDFAYLDGLVDFDTKENRVAMTIRVPASMKRALVHIEKFGNRTMTDVLVEGAEPVIRRELTKIQERLKIWRKS